MDHHDGVPTAESVDRVIDRLRAARRVVALTGAGISTGSGIPDFRGPQGVWTKDPAAERLSSLQSYMADTEVRRTAWQLRLTHPAWTATPNAGHRSLAELEQKGKLNTLVTQNIDGLHQRAGTSSAALIEIHGTIHEVTCMECGDRGPMQAALDRVRAGEEDPPCARCSGISSRARSRSGRVSWLKTWNEPSGRRRRAICSWR